MEKRILYALLIIALLNTNIIWAADDDRLAELEKKIEAMHAAYESKIDSLESRIAELEGEKAKTPVTMVTKLWTSMTLKSFVC